MLATKKAQRKAKRKARRSTRVKMRDGLIAHFGLNKYATNIAICFCIHKKTGNAIPGTDHGTGKMMAGYWSVLNNPQAPRKPKPVFVKKMTAKEFYSSKKWIELRYIALEQGNGRCSLCGATAADGVQIHVDHIKPRSKFPELQYDLNNTQILCGDCNFGKSNYDDRDWRLLME